MFLALVVPNKVIIESHGVLLTRSTSPLVNILESSILTTMVELVSTSNIVVIDLNHWANTDMPIVTKIFLHFL